MLPSVIEIVLGVISGFVVTLISFAAGRASSRFSRRRRYGHLRQFLGDAQSVIVILPNFGPTRVEHPELDRLPKNVLMMPAFEGGATARLVVALREAKPNLQVDFEYTSSYPANPRNVPVFCIGGPSVNAVTRELLKGHGDFEMRYPEHRAYMKGLGFLDPQEDNEELIEDYGFLALGESRGAPYALMFGVYSAGTWTAVQVLTALPSLGEPKYVDKVRRREKLFVTAHTRVDGLHIDPEKISLLRHWSLS